MMGQRISPPGTVPRSMSSYNHIKHRREVLLILPDIWMAHTKHPKLVLWWWWTKLIWGL